MTRFTVKEGNVLDESSDLLLLKYAQSFYGADKAVAAKLISSRLCSIEDIQPPPGDFVIIETNGVIPPKNVMFLGTPPLRSFNYSEMEEFARRAAEKIADLDLPVKTLTTTIHGTGYGLDGGEALQRLVHGFRQGLYEQELGEIERITFLTLGKRSERMLRKALMAISDVSESKNVISEKKVASAEDQQPILLSHWTDREDRLGSTTVVKKRRIFVAMPFSEEFQNVYEYGIYPAVRNSGFICEKVDETHFTGDVLKRIRGGIEAADLVIADMTEGRPNVYLEVGYAWGKGIPVIFVAKKGENLHFDVSTHRCIFYGRFSQFAKDLEELIRGIQATEQ